MSAPLPLIVGRFFIVVFLSKQSAPSLRSVRVRSSAKSDFKLLREFAVRLRGVGALRIGEDRLARRRGVGKAHRALDVGLEDLVGGDAGDLVEDLAPVQGVAAVERA